MGPGVQFARQVTVGVLEEHLEVPAQLEHARILDGQTLTVERGPVTSPETGRVRVIQDRQSQPLAAAFSAPISRSYAAGFSQCFARARPSDPSGCQALIRGLTVPSFSRTFETILTCRLPGPRSHTVSRTFSPGKTCRHVRLILRRSCRNSRRATEPVSLRDIRPVGRPALRTARPIVLVRDAARRRRDAAAADEQGLPAVPGDRPEIFRGPAALATLAYALTSPHVTRRLSSTTTRKYLRQSRRLSSRAITETCTSPNSPSRQATQ